MDIQLVIVSLIVLAAVVYIVWRAKKARKGQCSCGCGGCGKSCKPKTLYVVQQNMPSGDML